MLDRVFAGGISFVGPAAPLGDAGLPAPFGLSLFISTEATLNTDGTSCDISGFDIDNCAIDPLLRITTTLQPGAELGAHAAIEDQ